MKTQQVGCGFAQFFARRDDTGGLQPLTVKGYALATADVEPLNELLARAFSNNYEGVYVIFPDINSSDDVVGLIQSLCATPKWRCVEVVPDPPFSDGPLLIGLRWFLPDDIHMNYVLGFANLEEMPHTRKAPYTVLVLRTGPPGRAPGVAFAKGVNPKPDQRDIEEPPIPVHLADMPALRPTEEHVADLWAYTMKLKRKQLEGDAHARAAKAKVTFCLPGTARDPLAHVITETVPLDSASAM
ncbi:MAG: hypothetical protein V7609_2918 [Verrucomicrobiota bacterium]